MPRPSLSRSVWHTGLGAHPLAALAHPDHRATFRLHGLLVQWRWLVR
jgi:hypothetical protein